MKVFIRLLAMVLVSTASVSAANAANLALTGTWTGTQKCTKYLHFTGTITKGKPEPVTISITQSGSDLNVQIAGSTNIGLNTLKYNGFGYENPTKPGTGQPVLIYCSAASTVVSSVVFNAKTDTIAGTGQLKGELVAGDSSGLYRCKYKVALTDATNPAVTACP